MNLVEEIYMSKIRNSTAGRRNNLPLAVWFAVGANLLRAMEPNVLTRSALYMSMNLAIGGGCAENIWTGDLTMFLNT